METKRAIVFILLLICLSQYSYAQKNQELVKIVASDRGETNDQYGWACAISNIYAVVGVPDKKKIYNSKVISGAGAIYVLGRSEKGEWKEVQKIQAHDITICEYFGTSVGISDDYIIVGAVGDHEQSDIPQVTRKGAAYIYKRASDGNWQFSQKIVLSQRGKLDNFGSQVCISKEYIAVSAYRKQLGPSFQSNTPGCVYVFKRDDSGLYGAMQEIRPPENSNNEFGAQVALCENVLTISAPKSAAVYVYSFNKMLEKWQLECKLTQSKSNEAEFGCSVSCSENYILVGVEGSIPAGHISGTPITMSNIPTDSVSKCQSSGLVYLYKKKEGKWVLSQLLRARDPKSYAFFGNTVSITDSIAIIGAFGDPSSIQSANNMEQYSGAAYVFKPNKKGEWFQACKFTATPRYEWIKFGFSVATNGSSIIIGSRLDKTDAKGQNFLKNAGAAYIYTPSTLKKRKN